MDYVTKSALCKAFKARNNYLYKSCSHKEYAEILSAAEEMAMILGFARFN